MTSRNLLDESRGRSPRRAQEEPFEPRATTIIAPDSVPDLLAWYEAKEITGLSDGDEIVSWADLSSNSKTMTQYVGNGTGANKPTYRIFQGWPSAQMAQGINGSGLRSAHTFSGQGYTGYTAFIVLSRPPDATESGAIFGPNDTAGTYGNSVFLYVVAPAQWSAINNGGLTAYGTFPESNGRRLLVATANDNGTLDLYENGILLGRATVSGTLNWTGLTFLAFEALRHRVEAALYYTRRLTQTERTEIASYLLSTFRIPHGAR